MIKVLRRDEQRQTAKTLVDGEVLASDNSPHQICQQRQTRIPHLPHIITMGVPFDYAPERPEHIDAILNGLDRYNPETTTVFQDYVSSQCENQTYDCYANLALLKL